MPKLKRQSHNTRNKVMRQRRREARSRQTEEETAAERRKNAERQAIARAKQSEEEARQRRRKDAKAHAIARAKKAQLRQFEEMIRRIKTEASIEGKYTVSWQDGRVLLTPIGNNDEANCNDSFLVNEDIDIKSEILEFGPTEYLRSSFLSSAVQEEDYQAMGTYFAEKLALLQPDQRSYALKFMDDILIEADRGNLHLNSIEINRLAPKPLDYMNSAMSTENSEIHHDHDHDKLDISNLIPIPEFHEPTPPSFLTTLPCYNPIINDVTKPDISRLVIPGTSADALSILPQSIETHAIVQKPMMPSLVWLEQPNKDHSYVRKKAHISKTGHTDVVLPVSNFGTLSQIVVPAKMPNNETVTFQIFEEKE